MKKKVFAIMLAVALLSIIAVNGTLSYFTSTTTVDKNVMTIGEVKIKQVETFNANANLIPYVGVIPTSNFDTTTNNAIQKTVTVINEGTETAYVRTLFAFEAVMENGTPTNPLNTLIHAEFNTADEDILELLSEAAIKVGETYYYIYAYTYKNALAAGATTGASLKNIALDYTADNSFYGKVDGKYDILVLSQAVQAQGFNNDVAAAFAAAFPVSELATWFN